jgi:hypothetical protein
MAEGRKAGAVHGLAVYGLLLQLYPRAYLQRHREELLQNFQDLERTLPSRSELWRLIAKDLSVSLWSELKHTLWGQTAIRFAILGLMLVIAHRYPGHEESVRTFCLGYALGWFAGWFGRQWRQSSRIGSRRLVGSFGGQAATLVGAITVALAAARLFPDLHERLVFASCYGAVIAWPAGWWVNYRRPCRPSAGGVSRRTNRQ